MGKHERIYLIINPDRVLIACCGGHPIYRTLPPDEATGGSKTRWPRQQMKGLVETVKSASAPERAAGPTKKTADDHRRRRDVPSLGVSLAVSTDPDAGVPDR